jgi:hypothetical protein
MGDETGEARDAATERAHLVRHHRSTPERLQQAPWPEQDGEYPKQDLQQIITEDAISEITPPPAKPDLETPVISTATIINAMNCQS